MIWGETIREPTDDWASSIEDIVRVIIYQFLCINGILEEELNRKGMGK